MPLHELARAQIGINDHAALDAALLVNEGAARGGQPDAFRRIGAAQEDFRAVSDFPAHGAEQGVFVGGIGGEGAGEVGLALLD